MPTPIWEAYALRYATVQRRRQENFMLSEKYNSGFALALMRKDLQTAQGFIERMGTPGGFANVCLQTWAQAEQALDKGADHTAMHKFVRSQ